jgi:hypothetical protein
MTSRTDPLASTKCQGNRRVVSEAPIFLKKPFRSEFLWIWVYLWIVQDCPAISPINVQILVDRGGRRTMHWLPVQILIGWAKYINTTINRYEGQNRQLNTNGPFGMKNPL